MKHEELKYLAGAFDEKMHCYVLATGNIQVSFLSRGKLPRMLVKEFGGTCFSHGSCKRLWYRVQGKNAARLLELVLPHLKNEAKNVRSILDSWNEHQSRLK